MTISFWPFYHGCRGPQDCFVGLTPTSLWAMDLPTIRADMSASDIASKLKWRKVLDLPIEKKQEQVGDLATRDSQ